MAKYPSEIFGFPFSNTTSKAQEARRSHSCPFVEKVCYKQSRLIDYPFGVCSAHVNGEEVARFNPQLARVVALDWAKGVDVIAKEIGNKVYDMYSSRDKP